MTHADRIVDVRAYLVKSDARRTPEPSEDSANSTGKPGGHWLEGKVANPMTRYPEFRDNRSAAIGPAVGGFVVQVESASGHVGYGTSVGGLAGAAIVEQHLAYLVEGERASAHERLWDRMYSSTLRYGRKGLVLHAISAVDIAVWDLHGQITQSPVHELLGGRTHDRIRLYATGPRADQAARFGFAGGKLPLVWAPCEGQEGFERNVAIAREARESVPDGFPLMYDCWMALDVDYAARLAHAVHPLGFQWIEEPLLPDDYRGHERLRARIPPDMMLTTGEHEYTAAGFELLCRSGVDIVQPDPAWCGGLTELRRIAAVARAHGVKLVPHAGGMVSYHFVASRPECELAEFPMVSPDGHTIAPQHAPLFSGEAVPVDGWLEVGDAPGFGLTPSDDVQLVRPVIGDST
ncbi:MAG TPA: L-rhamnonate dehydratase [Actinopolymorphaceae bacterium]